MEPLWNVYVDGIYTDTSDRRNGLDIDGHGFNVTLGADRLLTGTLVAGASLSVSYNETTQFRGISKSESTGLTLSPYVSFEVLPRWTLNLAPGFGWTWNDNEIGPLGASYSSYTYSGSITATGDYALGRIAVRPKLSAYYAHTETEEYDTVGTIRGTPISLRSDQSSFNFGVADFTLEVNTAFNLPRGIVLIPYVEGGVSYEFERPNDGKIRTSELELVDSSPWVGTIRAGVRALVTDNMFIEVKGGYLSLGREDLHVWEAGVFVSIGF